MTNSAFKRFGIDHLSPSSINTWIEAPGPWAMRYLIGVRDETGPAMARGTAVETGLLHILHGRDGALEAAESSFDQNMQGEVSDDIDAERKLIKGMLHQCALWNAPSKILGSQLKVEHWFDGVSVPTIGYLDFALDGVDVDLKTTKACPSKPRASHARQVALYRAARQTKGALLYVTEKRHAYFELDDISAELALSELHAAALSLERFLSRFDDAEDAIRCLPFDTDHYRFSERAKQKLVEMHMM